MMNVNVSNNIPTPNVEQVNGVFPGELKLPEKRPVEAPEQVKIPESQAADQEKSSKEDIVSTVRDINNMMRDANQALRFGIYDGTDQLYVQVIDMKSKEVIKMMPPEKLLSLRTRLQEAVGLVLDEEV